MLSALVFDDDSMTLPLGGDAERTVLALLVHGYISTSWAGRGYTSVRSSREGRLRILDPGKL